jgi:hypothetical protein
MGFDVLLLVCRAENWDQSIATNFSEENEKEPRMLIISSWGHKPGA